MYTHAYKQRAQAPAKTNDIAMTTMTAASWVHAMWERWQKTITSSLVKWMAYDLNRLNIRGKICHKCPFLNCNIRQAEHLTSALCAYILRKLSYFNTWNPRCLSHKMAAIKFKRNEWMRQKITVKRHTHTHTAQVEPLHCRIPCAQYIHSLSHRSSERAFFHRVRKIVWWLF